jgi:hypothetical protein
MRLSRRVWLILGAIVLIAALVGVYVVYFRQAEVRNDLSSRLTKAQASVATLTTDRNDLEDQLAQAQSLLDASQAKFPQSVESIEYGEYLYEIAHDCNVELLSLSFPKPTSKKAGGVTYSVVSLTLPISGALDNIFDFIDTLITDDRFASTEVTGIKIGMGGGGASATINVDVYAHKG